jgi:osmotically-inducible protein OsmY
MRLVTIGICALALAGLTGCNERQKVEASNSARRAGDEIKQATARAQHDLSDGTITLKVKTALVDSDKLDTSAINVDTKDKVVHLRGTAASADQKQLAERIARDTVGKDVKVVSELGVRHKTQAKEVR